MSLVKIATYNPNYQNEIFRGSAIETFDVYENIHQEKVGSIDSILVNENGSLRYLVIDGKSWGFDKKVLLPIDRCRIDYSNQRIYALNLTKEQIKNLSEYQDDMLGNYNYEETVRSNYFTQTDGQITPYDYNIREAGQETIRLYEERLIANKNRQKIGDVTIGKTVTTEIARASIPIEKERVIVEQNRFSEIIRTVSSDEANFGEGVIRMEIYEETANIQKEAFVRGEVIVKKVVERDLVTAEEILRREELKIDGEADSIIEMN